MAPNAGIPPRTPTKIASAEMRARPEINTGRSTLSRPEDHEPPRQHENRMAPAPLVQKPSHRGHPDDARPAHGKHGQQRHDHAKHHRRRKPGDGDPDADQHALNQSRERRAEDDGARDVRELAKQPVLALLVQRNQSARAPHRASPSRKKKNSRNSMIEKPMTEPSAPRKNDPESPAARCMRSCAPETTQART